MWSESRRRGPTPGSWAHRGSGQSRPQLAKAPAGSREGAVLQLIQPADGAEYLLDPTLRAEHQTVRLRAAASDDRPVEWHVDGKLLARASAAQSLRWQLRPGRHVVEVRDSGGASAQATIVVR